MQLTAEKEYFLSVRDEVLRKNPTKSTRGNAINHLILGDELHYLNETDGEWAMFHCRRSSGWLKIEWVTDQRLLEVNFVDIGQGDGCHVVTPDHKVLLIDAGEGIGFDGKGADNMLRFMNWRYNLRNRKVPEVDGVTADDPDVMEPLRVDYAIISHPDLDHYYGFLNLFKHPKIDFIKICHNGIIERSIQDGSSSTWMYDFGRKVPPLPYKRKYHLWDTVLTHHEMVHLLETQKSSSKYYMKTLVAAYENNPSVNFQFLSQPLNYLDHFDENNPLSMEILGPLTEPVEFEEKIRQCILKLGNESKTKNGHSIVFQLRYGNVKMILGGDLNTESQDYLAQFYSGESTKMSDLEKDLKKIKVKLVSSLQLVLADRQDLEQDLDEKTKLLELIISKTKRKFGTDIAKACHHGSSDVLDSFLRAINPLATVISSGDNESHSHPRPDALGAYGKSSRGDRPLIFSTELARSTNEFSYPIKFYAVLKKLEERMNELTRPKDKEIYRLRMENLRDSNVARYGMITVRTDGEQVIVAQKLERSRGSGKKWDIYELKWNEKMQAYET
ncbi:MAG: beta-lactamase superfamily II metal-dependent hydrolase [Crocinitomix sp.]|jgi:beta-lactamase superfamily II metal-dependent hydrolase